MGIILRRLLILLLSLVFLTGCVNWVERKMYGVREGVVLEGYDLTGMYRHEVERIVGQLALEKEKPPQNATIDRITGQVVPEKTGITVLVKETVDTIFQHPGSGRVELISSKVKPLWTEDKLKNLVIVGEYHTPITGEWQRAVNIKLAAQAVHNVLLLPGEEFSFNRLVGPRSAQRGYIGAPEISGDQHVMGIGGGVCQVSTTLYMVVKELGLKITERHQHSAPVDYISRGQDAAVYWGILDFRFENSSPDPIVIQTAIIDHRFHVKILGRKGNN